MRKDKTVILLITLLAVVWSSQAVAQLAATPWPKPGKDARNTSFAGNVPIAAPVVKWQVSVTKGPENQGVIIDTEGNIVFKTPNYEDGSSAVVSVNSGGVVWETTGVGSYDWGTAIAANDTLYCENAAWGTPGSNELAKYNPTNGAEVWAMPLSAANDSTPTVMSDGIIVLNGDGKLYGVSDNGASYSVQWSIALPESAGVGPPALSEGTPNRVYISMPNDVICAEEVSANNWTIAWTTAMGRAWRHPAVGPDGNVYLSHFKDNYPDLPDTLIAFNGATGAVLWSVSTPPPGDPVGNHFSLCAFNSSGDRIYFGGHSDGMWCYNTADGSLNWTWQAPEGRTQEISASPSVIENEGSTYMYVPSHDGWVYCLKDEGTSASLLWSFNSGQGAPGVAGQVAVDSDGTVYLGPKNSKIFALRPWDGGVMITTSSLPDGTPGEAYSAQLETYAGVEPFTWSIVSGSLPNVLNLNTSTGEISGTPTTAEVATFEVKVQDSDTPQTDDTVEFTITIEYKPIEITQAGLSLGEKDVAYSQAIATNTAKTPYTWSVAGGTLPGTVTLNASTGVLSGTPDAYGDFTFKVKVVDADLNEAYRDMTIQVPDPDLWQFFHRTKRHIGTATSVGPATPRILWETPGQAGGQAPVFNDGVLYWILGWATYGNGPSYNMRAVDASDGSTIWYTERGSTGHNHHTAAIGLEGLTADTVYFEAYKLFDAVNIADGSLRWSFFEAANVYGNMPVIDSTNNDLYIRRKCNECDPVIDPYLVYQDLGTAASVVWTSQVPVRTSAAPTLYDLYDEGEIFLQVRTTNTPVLVAYKVSDKSVLWSYYSDAAVYTTPVVDSTNHIYIGQRSAPNKVLCIDGEDGTKIWEASMGADEYLTGCGALSMDQETFYIASIGDEEIPSSGGLYAIATSDGSIRWKVTTTSDGVGAARYGAYNCTVDGGGKVYFTAAGHKDNPYLNPEPSPTMYCVMDSGMSGTVLWTMALDDKSYAHAGGFAFSIAGDGTLYAPIGPYDGAELTKHEALIAFKEVPPEKPVITDVNLGSLSITFTSDTLTTYRVEASTGPYDYDESLMTWSTVADDIPGQEGTTTWGDTSTPSSGEKYYRVYAKSIAFGDVKADDTVGLMVLAMANARNMVSSPFEPYPDYDSLTPLIMEEDFEDNTDGRFESANCVMDFNLTDELVLDTFTPGQWIYCWDKVYQASPAWDPAPPYDFTGAQIMFDVKWVLDTQGDTRDFSNQVVIHRMYSGIYNEGSMTWSLTGYEDFHSAPVSGENGVWVNHVFTQGEGTITNFESGVYDPSNIYYWRWHCTDWDYQAGYTDEIHFRNWQAREPYRMGESTLDKIVGNQLTGHPVSQWAADQVAAWDADAQTYILAWLRAGQGWRAWDTMDDPPTFGLDSDKGYWFTINNTPTNVTFFGRVVKENRSIPLLANRNMVGTCFPVGCPLTSSNLVGSGFTGHPVSQWASDKIEFWNAAGQTYVGVWYRAGGGWRAWDDMNNPPTPPDDAIDPGEGWWKTVNNTPFTWTYKVPPRPVED